MDRRVVVKITGSLFDPLEKEEEELSPLVEAFKRYRGEGRKFYLVTGGGRTARQYIEVARRRGVEEVSLDMLGILISRVNAQLLIYLLGEAAYPNPLTSLEEFSTLSSFDKILVSGGLLPGISTNAVSALIAEVVKADLLITMTRAGALYDKDPERYGDAKPLASATIEDLKRILSPLQEKAGVYPLLDQTAISIISRSRIPTIITKPRAEDLEKALKGEKTGTKIIPE